MIDEQRIKAYVGLIEQLLGCSQGQEAELLQANAELVDAGLLEEMERVAVHLESQGDSDAKWLRGFAAQLSQALGLETANSTGTEDAARFLLETLQLVAENQGNTQQVYAVWAQQQERLNLELLAVMPQVMARLFTGEAEQRIFVAAVLVGFGNLIQQFPLGTRWLNLELSIEAYQLALQVRTPDAFPEEWATTQNNLALAYKNRIRGEGADNLEQAITACQLALQVRTPDAFPEEWATTQNNLALAYKNRIRGDRAENLEQAIAAYQLALKVYTPDAFPQDWATTQNNLANAYTERIRGERAENLEQAIAVYQLALKVRTPAFPEQWATTQNNLALAYNNRIWGDRAENLEQAIAGYQLALQVYTPDDFRERWAGTQNNLALAYSNRIRGDRAENLEDEIAAYQLALKVYTSDAFPQECRRTARNLGNLHFEQQTWSNAAEAYDTALSAYEVLYQACIFLDGKAAELAETADLPRRSAYTFARIGNLQKAVEVLEQGRARGLSESLNRDRADLDQLQQLAPVLYEQYQSLTTQLRSLENQQRASMTSSDLHNLTPEDTRETAIALRQQLNTLIQEVRQVPSYEAFLTLPTFEDVRRAVTRDRPLVYLVSTSAGSLALVVTPDDIESIWLNNFAETQLIDLLNNTWLKAYRQSHLDRQAWFNAIDSVTHQLWQPLMEPLIRHLKTHNFHRATLIPTGYFSLLPLHAAWTENSTTPTGRHYALDDIHFTHAPNAQSLSAAQEIATRTPADSILAIDNPTQDLKNSEREVHAAIANFQQRTVLRHTEATIEAVRSALADISERSQLSEASIVHFSCHGKAELTDPLNSGLQMSDGLLTLRDILALNLSDRGGVRLAILSACETGLSGIENADEAISLPTGLLQAGVAGVIASLWSVSDLSTMLLLTKFYDFWRGDQALPPAQALRQAQIWLRDTTNEEKVQGLEASLPEFGGSSRFPESTARVLYDELTFRTPSDHDFAHPFHWAAFSYTGL